MCASGDVKCIKEGGGGELENVCASGDVYINNYS